MVLHELRGPLGLMATAARSAADDCQDADLRSRCEMIVRAAESMLRTTNQVFQLNRALQAETPERFSPAAVAAEITDTFRALGVLVQFESCPASPGATCFGVRAGLHATCGGCASP